jgi:hypothetical protein
LFVAKNAKLMFQINMQNTRIPPPPHTHSSILLWFLGRLGLLDSMKVVKTLVGALAIRAIG